MPFYIPPPKTPKYQNFEKIKKLLKISRDACFHKYGVHILGHFLPFYPHYWPQKSKFRKKNLKKTGDIILLHICTTNKDVWFLRYRGTIDRVFGHFGLFFATDPPNLKKQNFEKMKKSVEILSFYTCVQQTTIIWCMVPEKWSTEGRIFCYFGLFFALLPPTNPENQYLKKWKKTHRDIIILHKCTINDIHMMSSSWDKKCDWQNFLSFWAVFCPFTSLTTKKCQEISFYTSVPNFGHFGLFFATDPPNLKKTKFWKNEKKHGDIIILHSCVTNDNHMMYGSWEMEHRR